MANFNSAKIAITFAPTLCFILFLKTLYCLLKKFTFPVSLYNTTYFQNVIVKKVFSYS